MDLDNILTTAKEVFESAYKKTGDVVAAQKQKYELSVMHSRLSKHYEELGKLCYSAIRSNNQLNLDNSDILGSKISARMAQIEEIQNEILTIKNQKPCSKCGAPNNIDSSYCAVCGEKLYE